jgi:hypothetical protein
VTGLPVPSPPLQVYVAPPDAVRVVELPAQIGLLLAAILTVKLGLMVMVIVAVPVQPAVVPVTVYVVVVAGETVTGFPVPRPPLHEYDVAPLAVSVVDVPEQIGLTLADMETVGFGFTVTVTVAVPVQPAVVPVTV